MADASEIKYAEQMLQVHLIEWRDAGGHIESVTGAILQLIVARERFAEAVRARLETSVRHSNLVSDPDACGSMNERGHACDLPRGHGGMHDWEQDYVAL